MSRSKDRIEEFREIIDGELHELRNEQNVRMANRLLENIDNHIRSIKEIIRLRNEKNLKEENAE